VHATHEKAEKDANLFHHPPGPEDAATLHALFMQARPAAVCAWSAC
jgi:hypothetical protein